MSRVHPRIPHARARASFHPISAERTLIHLVVITRVAQAHRQVPPELTDPHPLVMKPPATPPVAGRDEVILAGAHLAVAAAPMVVVTRVVVTPAVERVEQVVAEAQVAPVAGARVIPEGVEQAGAVAQVMATQHQVPPELTDPHPLVMKPPATPPVAGRDEVIQAQLTVMVVPVVVVVAAGALVAGEAQVVVAPAGTQVTITPAVERVEQVAATQVVAVVMAAGAGAVAQEVARVTAMIPTPMIQG